VHDGAALSDSARLTGSRGLTRRRHRPPAIERHLLEQAAVFISPMSALQRITDSSRTSRQVRKVPLSEVRILFDHLVGAGEQRLGHFNAHCSCGD
jgi:hypothetical protein